MGTSQPVDEDRTGKSLDGSL